jgi:hypothetical protein
LGKVKLNCINENIGYWPLFLHSPDLETLVQFRGEPERGLHCRNQGQLLCHFSAFTEVWQRFRQRSRTNLNHIMIRAQSVDFAERHRQIRAGAVESDELVEHAGLVN